MDCERANELIPLYLDQSLEDNEEKELRAHLLQCKACKQELIELEEVISKLQIMPKQALPPGYHEELMEKIRASTSVQAKKKRMNPWMGTGVAAAVIAVAVYAGGGFDTMLQNRESSIVNEKIQGEIAAADEALLSPDGATMLTEEGATTKSTEEVFENMDEVLVLDTAEAEAAIGSLPGNVVSAVVPSDEEIIIIDDSQLVGGGTIAVPMVVADAPVATEPIIVEALPQEAVQPVVQSEPTQPVLLAEVVKERSAVTEDVAANEQSILSIQENLAMPANEPTEAAIVTSDTEVAWETIPEEDPLSLIAEGEPVQDTARPLENATEVPNNGAVSTESAIPTIPTMGMESAESAIGLKKSSIVSMNILAPNMQEVFQMLSDYVISQGGMVLHEVLVTGLHDSHVPIIPENRILFKIPKAVYETTMGELSKISTVRDFVEWEAPMDMAYEVLKQERHILEKNGYQDLSAKLGEYDRKIATWEQEEEYMAVYITVSESMSVEE